MRKITRENYHLLQYWSTPGDSSEYLNLHPAQSWIHTQTLSIFSMLTDKLQCFHSDSMPLLSDKTFMQSVFRRQITGSEVGRESDSPKDSGKIPFTRIHLDSRSKLTIKWAVSQLVLHVNKIHFSQGISQLV